MMESAVEIGLGEEAEQILQHEHPGGGHGAGWEPFSSQAENEEAQRVRVVRAIPLDLVEVTQGHHCGQRRRLRVTDEIEEFGDSPGDLGTRARGTRLVE